jgi:hypothetical protein
MRLENIQPPNPSNLNTALRYQLLADPFQFITSRIRNAQAPHKKARGALR